MWLVVMLVLILHIHHTFTLTRFFFYSGKSGPIET